MPSVENSYSPLSLRTIPKLLMMESPFFSIISITLRTVAFSSLFFCGRIVIPVIFDRYRIGKNIVRQNCSVPVENPSSCALYFSCFLNLEFVVVQIALALTI